MLSLDMYYFHEKKILIMPQMNHPNAFSLLSFFFLQYLAACIVSGLASLSIGTVLGFSAILLPQLEQEGHIDPKSQEASWIGK